METQFAFITEFLNSLQRIKGAEVKLPLSVEMAIILISKRECESGKAFSALASALSAQLNSSVSRDFRIAFCIFLRIFGQSSFWLSQLMGQERLARDNGLVLLNLGVVRKGLSAKSVANLKRFSRTSPKDKACFVIIPATVLASEKEIEMKDCVTVSYQSRSCTWIMNLVSSLMPCVVGVSFPSTQPLSRETFKVKRTEEHSIISSSSKKFYDKRLRATQSQSKSPDKSSKSLTLESLARKPFDLSRYLQGPLKSRPDISRSTAPFAHRVNMRMTHTGELSIESKPNSVSLTFGSIKKMSPHNLYSSTTQGFTKAPYPQLFSTKSIEVISPENIYDKSVKKSVRSPSSLQKSKSRTRMKSFEGQSSLISRGVTDSSYKRSLLFDPRLNMTASGFRKTTLK